MLELIIFIIFVISLSGVVFILYRKIESLNSLPKNGTTGLKNYKIVSSIDNKVKEISIFFKKQIFLHKLLSWTKIIVLKIETKIDILLHRIRKKAQQVEKENKK
jgi:hypothetical protein